MLSFPSRQDNCLHKLLRKPIKQSVSSYLSDQIQDRITVGQKGGYNKALAILLGQYSSLILVL